MAFTGITATEAQIDQLSGANIDAGFTVSMKVQSLLQWESYLNSETAKNWSDWYAGAPNIDFKSIVTMFTASGVAQDAINYNPDSVGRGTANLKLNVLRDRMQRVLETLRNKSQSVKFIEANQ